MRDVSVHGKLAVLRANILALLTLSIDCERCHGCQPFSRCEWSVEERRAVGGRNNLVGGRPERLWLSVRPAQRKIVRETSDHAREIAEGNVPQIFL